MIQKKNKLLTIINPFNSIKKYIYIYILPSNQIITPDSKTILKRYIRVNCGFFSRKWKYRLKEALSLSLNSDRIRINKNRIISDVLFILFLFQSCTSLYNFNSLTNHIHATWSTTNSSLALLTSPVSDWLTLRFGKKDKQGRV